MGRKIFVSYKYNDTDVKSIHNTMQTTRCRDYVNIIESRILPKTDNIYKGEHEFEDLSDKTEYYIYEHLKNKIYDSTLTIVLISPNMKEPNKWQRSQWIPWEVSYSLRKTQRANRFSYRNAILCVVLPNRRGNYNYYTSANLFPILKSNIDNGYIQLSSWDDFISNPEKYIGLAYYRKDSTPEYKIRVEL